MGAAVTNTVEIGGQPYRLTFKFGTLVLAENELGRPIHEVIAEGNMGFGVLSCLFWAVLQPAHRLTREASDNLVDEAGVEALSAWIMAGITTYFEAGRLADEAHDKGLEPAAQEDGKKGKPRRS